MDVCIEMNKFRLELDRRNIDWMDTSEEFNDEDWICRTAFKYGKQKWTVINGFGTYGGIRFGRQNSGLLEIWNQRKMMEPIGYLTAEEAAAIIFQ